jgi:hypothetical protein
VIDTTTEQLITLQQGADRFPGSRAGTRCHAATLWRWIKDRKLEGVRIGGRWLTGPCRIASGADRSPNRGHGREAAMFDDEFIPWADVVAIEPAETKGA